MATGKTLSRDYKHVKRHTPGRATTSTAGSASRVGLAIGLAVALGVHLHYQNLEPAVPEPAADAPPASAQAPEEPAALVESEEPARYDFYDMLPKQEVEVPESAPRRTPRARRWPRATSRCRRAPSSRWPRPRSCRPSSPSTAIDAKIQRLSLEDET